MSMLGNPVELPEGITREESRWINHPYLIEKPKARELWENYRDAARALYRVYVALEEAGDLQNSRAAKDFYDLMNTQETNRGFRETLLSERDPTSPIISMDADDYDLFTTLIRRAEHFSSQWPLTPEVEVTRTPSGEIVRVPGEVTTEAAQTDDERASKRKPILGQLIWASLAVLLIGSGMTYLGLKK